MGGCPQTKDNAFLTSQNLLKGTPMNESEKFKAATVTAITDLQQTFAQTQSRQLALGAMVKALLGQVPLAGLSVVLEEYEAEVDHQAAQLPPKFQQPQYWLEWSDAIATRQKQLQQQQHR